MIENDELTPEEKPEEEITESSSNDGMMQIDGDDNKITDQVSIDPPPPPLQDIDDSEMPGEPAPQEEEIAEVKKEPSRFQLFLRKALIWLGVVAAFFAAGVATFYFVVHQPKVAELEKLKQDMDELNSQVETLEAEKAILEIDSAALESAEEHSALLRVMVDTYDARYALGEENIVAAKSALSGTDATLDLVLEEIRSFDSGLADALPQRLDLIRTNLDRDVAAAIQDCDQLIDDLLAVEAALYP